MGIDSDSQYRTFRTAVKHSFTFHTDTYRILVMAGSCFEAARTNLAVRRQKTLVAKLWVQPAKEDELQLCGVFLPSVGTARKVAEPLPALIGTENKKLLEEGN